MRRDAIMAAHCHFEPAAQRRAVDRGDDRLGASLDRVDQLRQARIGERLPEFGDVRAGRKERSRTTDHDRLHRRIVLRIGNRVEQHRAQRRAERVHRGIGQHDLENVVMELGLDHRFTTSR
jgi:hypothetical protein